MFLINIPCGYTNQNKKTTENGVFYIKNTFPSLFSYFSKILNSISHKKGKGLMDRDDKGDYWWELRSCNYLEDFNKAKIVYPDISEGSAFSLVPSGILLNNTAYFIKTDTQYLYYLLGLLNSKLLTWYFEKTSAQLSNKVLRMFSIYVNYIPVKKPSSNFLFAINILVKKINKEGLQLSINQEIENLILNEYCLTIDEKIYIKNLTNVL